MSGIDYYDRQNTHNPICPYCGYENEEPWYLDMPDSLSDEDAEHECEDCEEVYFVTRHCRTTYTTRTADEEKER